jgi:hypothetical protein
MSSRLRANETRVVSSYLNGQSSTEIASAHDVSPEAVIQFLARRGIKRRSNSEAQRKHGYDLNFFDDINEQQKAYILGLLYADGCIKLRGNKDVDGRRHGSVVLSLKDRDLVVAVAQAMGADERAVHSDRGMYALKLTGSQIVERLIVLGCGPRKSFICEFPTTLPDELVRHFVRGYFDGDGSAYLRGPYVRATFVGTKQFLEAIQGYIPAKTYLAPHYQCPRMYELRLHNYEAVRYLYNWMYYGATIWLERKRAVFLSGRMVAIRGTSGEREEIEE